MACDRKEIDMKKRPTGYQAAVRRVKACLSIGCKVDGEDFSELEKRLYGFFLHQRRHPDMLVARTSRFTPNARLRIKLYPLSPKA